MGILRKTVLFLLGGAGYIGLELLWRGFSHWSMALCGGLCLGAIYRLSNRFKASPLFLRAAMGAGAITAVELTVGCIVNKWLGWHVWDYSSVPFNLMGQICLPYTLLWFLLCLVICPMCPRLKKAFFSA